MRTDNAERHDGALGYTHEHVIGDGHRFLIKEAGDGYVLRIERPHGGSGLALYDTLQLTDRETHALMNALMEAIGT
jgi:hypothetical protein